MVLIERDVGVGRCLPVQRLAQDAHAGHGVLARMLAEIDEHDGNAGRLQRRDHGVVAAGAVAAQAEHRHISGTSAALG
ncbi:hypothetical protein G6F31_021125 [Rhizopus arrhizus]|nr:hypothetical protein G6F31_021125 [Rhizopus arrhizus]